MADSGLETGSTSPHENTTSENSSTDFELVQAAEYASATDDDSDRIQAERVRNKCGRKTLLLDEEHCESPSNSECREKSATESESNNYSTTCSSSEAKPQSADTSQNVQGARLNADEIFQYESQMLNEPFYESECGSDENGSFEYIEPIASASGECEKTSDECKLEQPKIQPNVEESGTAKTETPEFERSRPADVISRDNSSTSGYYFIDASTLNDEVDIMSTNITQNQYANSAPLSYLMYSSSNYTDYTTNKSNNTTEEQTYKFTPLKTLALQSGHERVAEFERELKLTEYLQPFPESRKVKRVDSTSEEKADTSKPTVKESLAVEIKEADSGESAHPSPCPDNNMKLNSEQNEKTDTSSNTPKTEENKNDKDVNVSEDRRPSLIRRNTFELDSNDEKLSVLRQEYERRQGNLIFQSSIPQYSGHRVDGDSICHVLPDSSVVPPITEPSITFIPDVQITCNSQQSTSYLLDSCKCEISQMPMQKSYLSSSLNRSSVTVFPVIKSASDKSIVDCDADSNDTSDRCSSSLPVTLNSILEKGNRTEIVKRTKRDEATPIISGGVSTADYLKPSDSISSSPNMRRKMESTPIVSGGSVIMTKPEIKARPARMSSSMTAWVVDMSDCTEESKSRNSSRNMSQSFSTSECARKPAQRSSVSHEKHGSLGFFVNLKDMSESEPVKRDCPVEKKERDSSDKSYCEFYVDISDESNGAKGKSSERRDTSVKRDSGNDGEKKNIFSMFIGLHDTCESGRKVPTHRRSFSTVTNKLTTDIKTDDSASSNSSVPGENQLPQEEKREKAKPSVFMFIESDSPIVRRRTLSTSRPTFKRHSWNMDKTQPAAASSSTNGSVAKELMFRKEHKRAHSVSMDNRDVSKRSQAKTSSTSSTSERAHSLNDTAKVDAFNHQNFKSLQKSENNSNNMDTSSEDVFEFDARDTPPNSHVEIATELRASVNQRCNYEQIISDQMEHLEASEAKANYEDEFSENSAWEKTCTESTEGQTRKSETFDISSGSGPSPDSDNHDYELTDLLNGQVSGVNERTQIIAATGNSNKISETRKSLSETIKKIECELKEPEYNDARQTFDCRPSKRDGGKVSSGRNVKSLHLNSDKPSSSFVRLSDLDKTPIVDHASDVLPVRDDRSTWINSSISETSWIESKLGQGSMRSSGPVRPVSRKLVSVMSTSLPSKQKSPLEDFAADCEGEGIVSESDLSSMQSSMGRSGAGTYCLAFWKGELLYYAHRIVE